MTQQSEWQLTQEMTRQSETVQTVLPGNQWDCVIPGWVTHFFSSPCSPSLWAHWWFWQSGPLSRPPCSYHTYPPWGRQTPDPAQSNMLTIMTWRDGGMADVGTDKTSRAFESSRIRYQVIQFSEVTIPPVCQDSSLYSLYLIHSATCTMFITKNQNLPA